jgi:peptide chain release factor 3
MSWPISMGRDFKGVYLLPDKSLNLFESTKQKKADEYLKIEDLSDEKLDLYVGDKKCQVSSERMLNWWTGVYGELNKKDYLEGRVAPVFFW